MISEGVTQAFLFLLSDHSRLEIVIHGASHFGFGDDGALLKSLPVTQVMHALGKVPIEGRRQIAVTEEFACSF